MVAPVRRGPAGAGKAPAARRRPGCGARAPWRRSRWRRRGAAPVRARAFPDVGPGAQEPPAGRGTPPSAPHAGGRVRRAISPSPAVSPSLGWDGAPAPPPLHARIRSAASLAAGGESAAGTVGGRRGPPGGTTVRGRRGPPGGTTVRGREDRRAAPPSAGVDDRRAAPSSAGGRTAAGTTVGRGGPPRGTTVGRGGPPRGTTVRGRGGPPRGTTVRGRGRSVFRAGPQRSGRAPTLSNGQHTGPVPPKVRRGSGAGGILVPVHVRR